MLYGRLDDAQRACVAQAIADIAVRRRCRVCRAAAPPAGRAGAVAPRLLRSAPAAATREAEVAPTCSGSRRSPRERYRRYQKRLVDHNCALRRRLHNSTTPEQRQKAAKKLKG